MSKVQEYSIEDINRLKPKDSRLTAIGFVNDGKKKCMCICVCGGKTWSMPYRVVSGHSKSCGCIATEKIRIRSTKYFPKIRSIYNSYKSMMRRCYTEKDKHYKYYGGRGVTVCEEWRNDYQKFLDWALANGWRKGLQIDKDIKGDGKLYSPETCSWVTAKVNMQNMSLTKIHLYQNQLMSVSQVSILTGIPANVLSMRMNARIKRTIQQAVDMGEKKGISGDTKYHNYNGRVLSLMGVSSELKCSYGRLRYYVNDLNMPLEKAIQRIQA